MQNVLAPSPVATPVRPVIGRAGAATNFRQQRLLECRTDYQFIAMLDAYRSNGGLARAQEVVALFKRCRGADGARLASQIARRKVICLEWESNLWLPLFQFNRVDMTLRPGLSHVLTELTAVYDPWELALWFAQPNSWLSERTPADMLGSDLCGVLRAARADRFSAEGRTELVS